MKYGVLSIVASALSPALFAQMGQIRGLIQDDRGSPLTGAMVSITALPPLPDIAKPNIWPELKPYTATMQTAADGRYSFAAVPPGTYSICANARGADLLGSCDWRRARVVQVRSSQATVEDARLRRGHRLTVRINDAGNQLAGRQSLLGERISTYVGSGQMVERISNGRLEGRSWVSSILVPFDTDLEMSLRGQFYRLADSRGTAVDTRAKHRVPVRASSGSAAQTIDFHITGAFPGRN